MLTTIKCNSCGGILIETAKCKYYCPYCNNHYIYNLASNIVIKKTISYECLNGSEAIKKKKEENKLKAEVNKTQLFNNNFMLAKQAYEMRNLEQAHNYCSKALLYNNNNKRALELLDKIIKDIKKIFYTKK